MSFELTDEFPIELTAIDSKGQAQKIVHVFRAATEEDLRKYERDSPDYELKRNKPVKRGSRINANLNLWSACIVRVEGYTLKGQDLMTVSDWQKKVPPPHKIQAAEELYKVWREEPDDGPLDGESAASSNGDGEDRDARE